MKKYIIIPAYNEAHTIHTVVSDILRVYGSEYQVVVVNDASTDSTASEARRAGATILHHTINRYQGAALVTGTEYALQHGAEIIAHVDADGQHDIANIEHLCAPIEHGEVDVVLGSRFLDASADLQDIHSASLYMRIRKLLGTAEFSITRRLLLALGLIVNTLITGVMLTDAHNGLRAFSRYAAQRMDISQDGMAHNTEYIQEIRIHKLRYKEIPVIVHYNVTEKKSQGFFHGMRILSELFIGKFIR